MSYKIGERVFWRGVNRNYKGTVVSSYRDFFVVKIDGTEKSVLLSSPTKQTSKKPDKDGGAGGIPAVDKY